MLRELELVRQAREQQQQQEHPPQNDPPPDDGTSPMASSGAPAPGREPPCGSTGTNPATIHRPSDAGGHRWFKHPPIGSIIPPRDAPERDEATEATPTEASPEDDSPADAARRRPPPTLPHAMATLRPQVLRGGSTSRTSSPQSSASRSSSRTISCNASASAQTLGRIASRFCSSLRRRISRRTRKFGRRSSGRLGFRRAKAGPQTPRARGPT